MLTGPDIAGTLRIAQATSIPVILSGGISATSDIDTIRMESNGRIAGVIVGRALYEGRFNLADAIRRTAGREG
jgi:phosphoribosylformimino-5-aminoimidazole carboxamide ribotide isomerase